MAKLLAQEFVTNRDVLPELILESFVASGVAEQRLSVQQNRPQPKLDSQSHGRAFHQQWYERKIGCVEFKKGKVCLAARAYFLNLEFLLHGP